jgi:AcrR family transcriptional regulator
MPRPLSDTARVEMLRVARSVLSTEGVHACTVEEVARRSGIAKTTIYRHFGGVDGLVLAAVDGMVKEADPPDTGSLQGDLREIQIRYLRTARSPALRELFVWMVSRSMTDPEFARQFRAVRLQPRGVTVIALQRAIARGEIPPTTDIPLALHLIQGPFLSKRIVEDEELTDAELETLVRQVVRALGARGAG